MLREAAKRASRRPMQVAAMLVLGFAGALFLFGGPLRPAAVYIALPCFALLMFLGSRPGRHRA